MVKLVAMTEDYKNRATEMNLNKVGLEVFSFNKAAIKCYKKLGFIVEGTLRQELFRAGKYHDVIIMGLLREEWE